MPSVKLLLANANFRKNLEQRLFSKFDENKDQQLQLSEVQNLVQRLCESTHIGHSKVVSTMVATVFTESDENYSNGLSLSEFDVFFVEILTRLLTLGLDSQVDITGIDCSKQDRSKLVSSLSGSWADADNRVIMHFQVDSTDDKGCQQGTYSEETPWGNKSGRFAVVLAPSARKPGHLDMTFDEGGGAKSLFRILAPDGCNTPVLQLCMGSFPDDGPRPNSLCVDVQCSWIWIGFKVASAKSVQSPDLASMGSALLFAAFS